MGAATDHCTKRLFIKMQTLNQILDANLKTSDPDFYKTLVPGFVYSNLKESFGQRPYQQEAFGRFAFYWDQFRQPENSATHLLYHMATGSGKTIIMAGLIIYLYEKGYRNFLFFVNSTTIIETTENVSDLSVALSVKHDFYWLNVLLDKDYFRFSPQISLISGTQRFGFNQVSNANYFNSKSGLSVLQNTEELNLSESSKFKPLSLSARLRTEFSTGKFFFQPQILLDYYFPAEEKNFTTGFAITTGFIL